MPQITDLIGCDFAQKCAESALYLQIADTLSMSIEHVKKLIEKYGYGHIYANTGLVVPDSPRLRYKITYSFGTCIIIDKNGNVIAKTPESIGSVNRKLQSKYDKRERGKLRNCIRQKRIDDQREHMFNACQGKPSPKQQGKANSHADIGKYVYIPASIYRPKAAVTVYAEINPFKNITL